MRIPNFKFRPISLHKSQNTKTTLALVGAATVAAFSLLMMNVILNAGYDVMQNSDIQSAVMSEETQDEQTNFASIATSRTVTEPGVALYIDGSYVAACDSQKEAQAVLEEVKGLIAASYGVDAESATIANSVTFTEGLFEKDSIVNKNELLKMFGVEGNTLSTGTVDLDVSYTVMKEETENIPYETMYLDTDGKPMGYSRTLQDGSDGVKEVEYEVNYINDIEITENVVAENVVTEAKPEIIERGVKSGSEMTSASLKMFELPYVGKISSYFGWRIFEGALDYHQGLDITGMTPGVSCYGDDVSAAGSGVVEFASYKSGYGNYIIIQHPNGLKTGYAHLSAIGVTVGQEVKTGDVIGQIGNTGRSTGPHLHFEVIIGEEKTDPLPFLKNSELLGR